MKRILAVVLATVLMLCLFVSCGEPSKEEKIDKVLKALNVSAPVAFTMNADISAKADGEDVNMSMSVDAAAAEKQASGKVAVKANGTTVEGRVYFDGETLFAEAMGQAFKINIGDLKEQLKGMLESAEDEESSEMMKDLKEFFNEEKIQKINDDINNAFKGSITDCTSAEKDGNTEYTLTVDTKALKASLKDIANNFINELAEFASKYDEVDKDQVKEVKDEIAKALDGLNFTIEKLVVVLDGDNLKSANIVMSISADVEDTSAALEFDLSFDITATGKDVKVDDSLKDANAVDFMEYLQAAMSGFGMDDYDDSDYDYDDSDFDFSEYEYVEDTEDVA